MRFEDRRDAGRHLGAALARAQLIDPVVLALPRGGVPVGYEVARALNAPLDVFVARKIGAPGHPEFGIGAVAESGPAHIDDWAAAAFDASADVLDRLIATERHELERRVERYRGGRPLPSFDGRDVVLVDDGLATGVTAEAALRALRERPHRRMLLAVPVCAPEAVARLRAVADDVICLGAPADFQAVGQWYQNFDQTSDAEVSDLLAAAERVNTGG